MKKIVNSIFNKIFQYIKINFNTCNLTELLKRFHTATLRLYKRRKILIIIYYIYRDRLLKKLCVVRDNFALCIR